MTTIYDWLTVALFAGLVTHFLAFSVRSDVKDIPFGHYLLLSVACALANWLGNNGSGWAAILVLLAGGAYAYRFLRAEPELPHH
jgi:hypothetical protein